MAQYQQRYGRADSGILSGEIDAGLRAHMNRVYMYMAGGVGLTGVVAYLVAAYAQTNLEFATLIYRSPLAFVLMLAPLGFVLFLSFRIHKMSFGAAQIAFWAFAAVMGASLSSIFLRFTGMNIAQTFLVTAIAFVALSMYGYTTKKSLSGWGSFLFMGLVGIIIAAVVNIFLQSSMLGFVISAVGVLVFAGLTAYDTQRIKEEYLHFAMAGAEGAVWLGKAAIMGALSLYLDFINMFMMLLNIQSFLGGD